MLFRPQNSLQQRVGTGPQTRSLCVARDRDVDPEAGAAHMVPRPSAPICPTAYEAGCSDKQVHVSCADTI